jgi:hypothetical protein
MKGGQVSVPDAWGRRSLSAAAFLGGLGEQQRQEFLAGIKVTSASARGLFMYFSTLLKAVVTGPPGRQ